MGGLVQPATPQLGEGNSPGSQLQMAFPFRDNYSLVICLIGAKCRQNEQAITNCKKILLDSDKMVAARKITCVDDLNLGKVATFMEVSLPLACHCKFTCSQNLYLSHLYAMCAKEYQPVSRFTSRSWSLWKCISST